MKVHMGRSEIKLVDRNENKHGTIVVVPEHVTEGTNQKNRLKTGQERTYVGMKWKEERRKGRQGRK